MERIPQEVIDDLHRNGGGLRLKFRLKEDGVLFGWDIERDTNQRYHMVGGDFKEWRRYFRSDVKGPVVEMGWYIDDDGNKIEIDY